MLTYINIKNFAIIRDIELDFEPEMTSLTGETGAGKSIIIDSLELVLGARADTSLIRNKAERSEISAMFDLTNIAKARQWLIEQELDSADECIIRRTITNDGRSKSSINGNPCTQQTLRSISKLLLSIHGQHENQNLINQEYQRELLDAFADCTPITVTVKQLYNQWLKNKKELLELKTLSDNHQNKLDYLNHQLKELENIDLSLEHLENLRAEQKRLNNMEQFSTNLAAAIELASENDNGTVIQNLYKIKNQLETCEKLDPEISSPLELINNAIIQVEESTASLRQHLSSQELSPDRQREVEAELDNIHTLARKHQTQPEELSQTKEELEQQLENILNATSKIEELKLKVAASEKAYLDAANKLSKKRKLAAIKLDQLVSEKMQILGMTGGKFSANITPNANQCFSAHGLEKIEFLVSANPGHPLQPLNKVASGGEISRISLAIQTITAEKEVTPTLIFDEIDSGIGGKTADIVGQLLRKLAEKTQVICITHLPQIAAKTNNHIRVEKIISKKDTEVTLNTLNKKERLQEIARMLGGLKITEQTLAHAKEMLG